MASCGHIVEHYILCLAILSLTPGSVGEAKHRGRYTHDVTDYEALIPRKVDATGVFQSFEVPHFYDLEEVRSRRSAPADTILVRYALTLGGREHLVELWPNHGFLSPGLVSERRRRDLWRAADMKHALYKQCHYVGRVFGHPASRVALSACHEGLAGYVKTGEDQFFVEPAAEAYPDADGRHLHIAFRKKDLNRSRRQESLGPSICGVEDDWRIAWKNRFEWELQTNPNFLISSISNPTAAALGPRFLKVLVVVDKKFITYHKSHNPETYVLTLMNMVSDYYHDATLGYTLEVVVVRIMYLEKEEEELDLTISRNAGKTLESFKVWAQRVNPADAAHPNHHDVAVMITRYDICSSDSLNCNILGIASVAAACQPERAVCINEDSGLMTGVTISHEIGHVMGCAHDKKLKDGEDGCEPFAPDGSAYVMSMYLKPRTSIWSNCSRRFMETLIDTGMADCLLDEPDAHPFQLPDMPPGAMYDADYQCRDLLGAREACPSKKGEMCKLLWCKIDAGTCAAPGRPAADGTKCGEGYWCYGGECVKVGRRPAAVDGHWGPWGPWDACSRTCGGGIQRSERLCNKPPPRNKGRYCVGERHRYRVCNHAPCDPNEPTFREVQCSAFDDRPFEGQLHKWIPYREIVGRECELLCFNALDFYVSLVPLVKDGTPCRRGTKDMCVGGQCMHVGCDWVLKSEVEEDICGECGGDGTRCRLIKKLYSKPKGNRYVKIGSVPVDSRHVKIEEVKPTINTIAIANKKGNKFFINGNYTEYANGEYSFGKNVRGVYSHPETEREVLIIKGPTTEELSVYIVFYSGHNPGVRISYYEHNVIKGKLRKPNFEWEFLYWGRCSARCGGGSQIAEPSCVEETAGQVSASYCDPTSRPKARSRVCNRRKCAARWHTSPWGPCSGRLWGLQRRPVECRAENPTWKGELVLVENSQCVGIRPSDTRPCPKSVFKEWRHSTSTRHGKTKRTTVTLSSTHVNITPKPMPSHPVDKTSLHHKHSTTKHHRKSTHQKHFSSEEHKHCTFSSSEHPTTGRRKYRTTVQKSTSFDHSKLTTTELCQQTTTDHSKQTTTEPSKQTTTELSQQTTTDHHKHSTTDHHKHSTTDHHKHSTSDLNKHSTNDHRKHMTTNRKQMTSEYISTVHKKHTISGHKKVMTSVYEEVTNDKIPITDVQKYTITGHRKHSSKDHKKHTTFVHEQTTNHKKYMGIDHKKHTSSAHGNNRSTSVHHKHVTNGHSKDSTHSTHSTEHRDQSTLAHYFHSLPTSTQHLKHSTTDHPNYSRTTTSLTTDHKEHSKVIKHSTVDHTETTTIDYYEEWYNDISGHSRDYESLLNKDSQGWKLANLKDISTITSSTKVIDLLSSAYTPEVESDSLGEEIDDCIDTDNNFKRCASNDISSMSKVSSHQLSKSSHVHPLKTKMTSPSSTFSSTTSSCEFVIDRLPDSYLVFKEAPLIGTTCNKSLSEIADQEMGECLADTLDTFHGHIFKGKDAVERAKEIKKQLKKKDFKPP